MRNWSLQSVKFPLRLGCRLSKYLAYFCLSHVGSGSLLVMRVWRVQIWVHEPINFSPKRCRSGTDMPATKGCAIQIELRATAFFSLPKLRSRLIPGARPLLARDCRPALGRDPGEDFAGGPEVLLWERSMFAPHLHGTAAKNGGALWTAKLPF